MPSGAPKIVAVLSTKGGTGKTTICVNLSAALVAAGYGVLMVDADLGQSSLSGYLPLPAASELPSAECRLKAFLLDQIPASDAICPTSIPKLDILPSAGEQARQIEELILSRPDGRFLFRNALHKLTEYDFIFIDSWGTAGATTESVALASDIILSPAPPETMAAKELLAGTLSVVDSIRGLARMVDAAPAHLAVLNLVRRTRDSRAVEDRLRQLFAGDSAKLRVLDTSIPRREAFQAACSTQRPVFQHETPSEAAKATSATRAVQQLTNEVFGLELSLEALCRG